MFILLSRELEGGHSHVQVRAYHLDNYGSRTYVTITIHKSSNNEYDVKGYHTIKEAIEDFDYRYFNTI